MRKFFKITFFCVLLLACSGAYPVKAEINQTPHGPFLSNTSACASCHSGHGAPTAKLIKQTTLTGVCFTCHDGTGSSFNTMEQYLSGSGHSSYHSVKNTGITSTDTNLECVSCHDPHGKNPRLLSAQSLAGNIFRQGADFCNTCHGFDKREDISKNYYGKTYGSHVNTVGAHYNQENLMPESGTKVTCSKCHTSHVSSRNWLLSDSINGLCFSCHSQEQVKAGNVKREVKSSFSKASIHDIFGVTDAVLSCSNCHGPHTVVSKETAAADASKSILSDPDNTKAMYTAQSGILTDFCIKCHDGAPPVEPPDKSRRVPPVVFPIVSFTTNAGGWNKSDYSNSGHGKTGLSILCTRCHDKHGSDNPRLALRGEDTSTEDNQCLQCHNGTYAGAQSIKGSFNRTYRHPTLNVTGRHSDTEIYNNIPLSARHAECMDCHDPHAANKDTSVKPAVSGYIKNASGVMVTTNSMIRPVWSSLAANSPGYTFTTAIINGYELCYKCHSTYSYGTTPPANQWDVARDFNSNNPSYHAIEAKGKNTFASGVTNYSSSLINGWRPDSIMTCNDCHGDNVGTLKGVHGSNIKGILKAPYSTSTGTNENVKTDLCYNCHDWNVYGNRGGSNTNTGFYNSNRGNLHLNRHDRMPCMNCHVAIPHGSKRERLIAYVNDGMPLASSVAKINSWTKNTRNYSKSNCSTASGCHN